MLCRPQGHGAIGRIISMKNSNDSIWNQPATFRFVAQHLNHCATAVPFISLFVLLNFSFMVPCVINQWIRFQPDATIPVFISPFVLLNFSFMVPCVINQWIRFQPDAKIPVFISLFVLLNFSFMVPCVINQWIRNQPDATIPVFISFSLANVWIRVFTWDETSLLSKVFVYVFLSDNGKNPGINKRRLPYSNIVKRLNGTLSYLNQIWGLRTELR